MMVNVTERAKDKLLELRSKQVAATGADETIGLRLDRASPGQLGIFPDAQREGDQVVEHEGTPVLFVAEEIAHAVDGTTIDCEGEAQLVIRKN
jgi:hypothetical protein